MSDLWPGIDPRLQAAEDVLKGYEKTMLKAWTGERLARLGYMLGKGCNAADIAADPMFQGFTENEIHRRGQMLHRVFTACKRGDEIITATDQKLDDDDRAFKSREWDKTEIGKLFNAYERAHYVSAKADCNDTISDRGLSKKWDACFDAREALLKHLRGF